ncbi:hypothetical protein RRG08_061785 [Elysia crispata]|uniref:Uncharacterized protein n=1 Tax=Elysia crispata TaxID=231223 RepID=A0AAE1BC33_9GAST|nr:hypothetical protein RRG08_061785 [Elysia crispata]
MCSENCSHRIPALGDFVMLESQRCHREDDASVCCYLSLGRCRANRVAQELLVHKLRTLRIPDMHRNLQHRLSISLSK